MAQQIPLETADRADEPRADAVRDDATHEVAPDLAWKRLAIVNVVFVGAPGAGDGEWVLVDAGVIGTAGLIVAAAEQRFGAGSRPAAIVMTHGHFDHVGALEELAERWQVPVYAHALERPYLDGSASYPPPDPTVGGGLMSLLSPLYPRGPVDVSDRLRTLPADGSVPGMPGWRWLHTPGHTPGHVSFWREADRTIIAGDAFITTRQESAYAVAVQRPELHGPPMYYTPDWEKARASVVALARLRPELALTGHGPALRGAAMRAALEHLARDFDRIAVPQRGRYLDEPARAEDGTAYRRTRAGRDGAGADGIALDMLKGAIAGAVGVWAMDRLDWWMFAHEDPAARRRTQDVRPDGMDPAHVVAARASKAMGAKPPAPPHWNSAGLAMHYGLGIVPGAVYGALRDRVDHVGAGRGTLFGLGMFVVHDEIANPALGLAAPPQRYPWQAHARGLAAHLVYGLVTDAVLNLLNGSGRRRR